MISGTSADGIEVVIAEITGAPSTPEGPDRLQVSLRHHLHWPYEDAVREEVFAAFNTATGTVDRLCRLNFALGEAFASAALAAIEQAGLTPQAVDLIGSHGQTVWHIPPEHGAPGATLQLGEAAVIAERTGIPTISNFRARDMAAGGHGAPLVSYVDWLLFNHPTEARALQNIGGIANVTYLPPHSQGPGGVFAFDTGPGNVLIDDAAGRATDGAWTYDVDGQLAAAGQVDPRWLARLLEHPYFRQPPPKTTGRELFGQQMGARLWEEGRAAGLTPADIVATITALTAESIAQAYRNFLPSVERVIVSGGGTQNPTLMAMLRERLAPWVVEPIDAYGIQSAAKEALAFAVLAYETWHGRPGTLPSCTGARHATVLGNVTPGGPTPQVDL